MGKNNIQNSGQPQDSTGLHGALFNNTPNAVLFTIPDGTVLAANPAACRLFGRTEEDIRKIGRQGLVAADDPRLAAGLEKRLESDEYVAEYDHVKSDGTRFPARVHSKVVHTEDGQPRMILIITDITEEKKMYAGIRESEARFRALFENASGGIVVFDADTGQIIEANRKVLDRFGCDAVSRLNNNLFSLPSPYSAAEARALLQKTVREGHQHLQWLIRLPDGTDCWLDTILDTIHLNDTKRVMAIIIDITEQKKAVEQIARNEVLMRDMLEMYKLADQADKTESDYLDYATETVKNNTNSRLAFIGLMNEDETLFSVYSWSKETMQQCATDELLLRFPIPESGLWHKIIEQRKELIVNDYASCQDKKGYPAGHLPIVRFLGIPIFHKEKIVAIGAFANKETDYDDRDVHAATLVLHEMWNLIEYKRRERNVMQSEERFRLIVNSVDDVAYTLDTDMRHTGVYGSWLSRFGKQPEDLMGKTIWEAFGEPSRVISEGNIRKALSGESVSFEWSEIVNSKTEHHLSLLYPMRNEKNEVIGVFGLGKDITQAKQAEQAFEEEATRRRILMEQSRDGIVILDETGNVIEANQHFAAMHGYTQDDVLTLNMKDWIREDFDINIVLRGVDTVKDHAETQHRRKDGTLFDAEISINSALIKGQRLIFCICRDISERKQTEKTLRESEEFNARLLEASPFAISVKNPDLSLRYVNPAFIAMTGYSADELIGTAPPYPYWPADIPENDIQLFHENMAWGAEGKEGRFIRKNGEEFWVRINDTPVKMNGNTDYILTNWIDITATKKAEQSLRESEAFNAGLLEASPYPIYVIDPDLAIMYVNPAMEKLTGFSAEELTGKKPPYPYWGNDLPKDAEDLLHNAMANGVTGLEQRFVNKKGEQFWVRLANSPIQRGGKTGYLLTTWVDITETKKAEQQLRQSEAFNASLISASPNPMNAINLDGSIRYVNPALEKLTGFSAEELIGCMPPFPYWGERGASEHLPGFFQTITESFHNRELSFVTKDNRVINVRVTNILVKTGDIVDYVLSSWVDVTETKKAENALRESEAFNASLLNASPFPINVINPDFSIRYVNPALEAMTGYSAEELIGKTPPYPYWEKTAVFQGEAADTFYTSMNEGIAFRERRFIKKNGEELWVRITNTPVKNGDTVQYTLSNWQDVTGTRKAEAALRESEERYRTLFENAPVGVAISDDTSVIDANRILLEMHGYDSKEEFRNAPFIQKYYNPEDRSQWVTLMKKYGYVKDLEMLLLRKDGTSFWASFNSISRTSTSSGTQYILAMDDITERKTAEIALRDSEDRYRTLVNNINLGVFRSASGIEGKFIEVNRAMETMTGYSRDELLKSGIGSLYENREEREKLYNDYKDATGPTTREIRIRRKNGSVILVSDTKVPVRDGQGKVMYFDGILEDLTERKKIEEENQKIARLESVGILAGGIAHDFNNLLMGIMGNISLAMMDVEGNTELVKSLQAAEKATEQASHLTQQLLTFSRGGAPVTKTIEITSLIEESARFAMRGSGHKIEFSLPDTLWPVEADEGQINQVVTNLVINACEAMPNGGTVTVRAENTTVESSENLLLTAGRYVTFSVEDTGIGIQHQHLNRLFDPYFTTKHTGNGLGLATSYAIIRNHHGHITVESQPGQGTIFTIYIPASEKPAEAVISEGDEMKNIRKSGGKILVMDDEKYLREVLGRILEKLGYTPHLTADGEAAIKAYTEAMEQGEPFDAVILDLTIPGGMGGLETIANLRRIDPEVKAVMSSGYASGPGASDFRKHGFKAKANKPYTVTRIKDILEKIVTEQ